MNGFLKFCAVVGTGIVLVIGAAVTVAAVALGVASVISISTGASL
ncbi:MULTISPECIES: hypothetical protein [Schumannella]|uniref:Uncharacterized protein n=1 Tax=Schumannella luteola TaxID=472059 RepID=A0A852Y9E6_9MICO|nr:MULTISPECIES: hypothetical protein [Schumannella]NYG97914.1 hypothetical protein [Schumannella luteola]